MKSTPGSLNAEHGCYDAIPECTECSAALCVRLEHRAASAAWKVGGQLICWNCFNARAQDDGPPHDSEQVTIACQHTPTKTGPKPHWMVLPMGVHEFMSKCLLMWNTDEYIQNIFPGFTSEQREFVLTGHTPESWQELFGDEGD